MLGKQHVHSRSLPATDIQSFSALQHDEIAAMVPTPDLAYLREVDNCRSMDTDKVGRIESLD